MLRKYFIIILLALLTIQATAQNISIGISPVRLHKDDNYLNTLLKIPLKTIATRTNYYQIQYPKATPTFYTTINITPYLKTRTQFQYEYLRDATEGLNGMGDKIFNEYRYNYFNIALGLEAHLFLAKQHSIYTFIDVAYRYSAGYNRTFGPTITENKYILNERNRTLNLGLGYQVLLSEKWSMNYEFALWHFSNLNYISRLSVNFHF